MRLCTSSMCLLRAYPSAGCIYRHEYIKDLTQMQLDKQFVMHGYFYVQSSRERHATVSEQMKLNSKAHVSVYARARAYL